MEDKEVIAWLEQIKKLDELIRARKDDIAGVMERATKTTASLTGMPHCGGVSDKVGDGAIKLAELEDAELANLKRIRQQITDTIKLLPAREFGVIDREFVRGMTQEQIAFDMNYCTVQVWRIRKKALQLLKDVMKCNGM